MLKEVGNLENYLARYGVLLGQQAREKLQPLHIPARDEARVAALLRAPFDPQAHVIAAGVKQLRRDGALILVGECGTGKAQPNNSPVLTPYGWRPIGQLRPGDFVVDPRTGGAGKVSGVYPQGAKPVFRVYFNDGTYTRCCDEHLWLVTTQNQRQRKQPGSVVPLSDIRANLKRQYCVPVTAAVQFPQGSRPLPLDPYALGAFLGNGCSTSGQPMFSGSPAQADELTKTLPPGVELRRKKLSYDYSIAVGEPRGEKDSNPFTAALRDLGLMGLKSTEKFIPRNYLQAPILDRVSLLQGLMDTDGTASSLEFSTSSPRLADDLTELVEGLGGTVRRTARITAYQHAGERREGQVSYRLYVKVPVTVAPFRLEHKRRATTKRPPFRRIINVVEDGTAECSCIAVDTTDNLYLTDHCIVTHNTLMGQAVCHTHAAGRPYRGIVFCPPHLTKKWKREIEETLPGTKGIIVTSYRDLVQLRNRRPPVVPEWWIMSNSVAKLGTPWRAAYKTKRKPFGIAHCPDCWEPVMEKDKETDRMLPVPIKELEKKKHACNHCGAQLWQYTHKMDRWPAASYVHRHLRGVFTYLVPDEVHEEKGDDTAQANALGALAATVPYIAALTGTLIGGYADHLRTLLFRLAPRSLVQEGFGWSSYMPFNERYGRIETKITEKQKSDGPSLRTSRGSSRTKTKYVRPGVMPTLFGRHLIDKTIFLALEEVADNLPELEERVIGVPLDDEQGPAYAVVEAELTAVVKDMVVKGDKRLLGAMLQTLLCYPDKPYGWPMIGYYDTNSFGDREWVDVVQPEDLDPEKIRPKEQAIVDAVLQEHAEGRKTWIFTVMTDKRDVCTRLQSLLERRGLRVAILRASVETKKREEWIAKHGPLFDVVISHPQLVQTGLDLFDKGGRYNFPTLMFYLTGYNTFTLRQASRRAWRIGQHELCRVFYFYYQGSMQERAMELMGKKLSAAEAIEGKFSAEGLAAMAGEEGSAEMALARSLVNRIGSEVDATRAWKRISARPTAPRESKPMVMAPAVAAEPEPQIVRPRRFTPRPMPGALPAKQLSLFGDVA